MRIIGCPHNLVRPDIVGQDGKASLDRLERDPAGALNNSLGRVLSLEIIAALLVAIGPLKSAMTGSA